MIEFKNSECESSKHSKYLIASYCKLSNCLVFDIIRCSKSVPCIIKEPFGLSIIFIFANRKCHFWKRQAQECNSRSVLPYLLFLLKSTYFSSSCSCSSVKAVLLLLVRLLSSGAGSAWYPTIRGIETDGADSITAARTNLDMCTCDANLLHSVVR